MRLRTCILNRNGATGEVKIAHDNLCNPEEALIEGYVFTREELGEFCKHIHYAWDETQETFEDFLKGHGCE